jgi:DNA-binding beta-propeller fold protein YncE
VAKRTVVALATVLAACSVSSITTTGFSSTRSEAALAKDKPVGKQVGCSTATATGPNLSAVATSSVSGLLDPFGVAFSPDNTHVFVTALTNKRTHQNPPFPRYAEGAIDEYQVTSSGLVAERQSAIGYVEPLGLSITPDGRYLVAAEGSGATILSINRIEQPSSNPAKWVVGTFSSRGSGAIETDVSPDGSYVFVSLEESHELAVFNLKRALRHGFSSDLVGYIPVGIAPVGMAVSADGRYLFATSEDSSLFGGEEGTLSTIDLRTAERSPDRSVVSTVWAGCNPVRVVATRTSVFVTARASDEVLSFSASALVSHPATALTGQAQVGEAPVGLALADRNRNLVVGDSNRFNQGGAASNLAVVSIGSNGGLKLAGYLPAGQFPRDMAASPNGRQIVVVDYLSGSVQQINSSTLP